MRRVLLSMIVTFVLCSISYAAEVQLEWTPNTPNPDGYRLYQKDGGGAYDYANPVVLPSTGGASGDIPGNLTTAIVPDLGVDGRSTKYCWVLRAFIGQDDSGDSNEVCYNVDLRVPPEPSSVSASWDKESSSITVQWNQDPSVPVKEWKVYYSLTSGSSYQLIDTVSNDGSSHSITASFSAVPAGDRATVYFTVVAFRSDTLFSQNSGEVVVDVDRRELQIPVLRLITIPVE